MNVACPSCDTIFRVDPERVPERGVRARCSRCQTVFRLSRDGAVETPAAVSERPEPAAAPAAAAPAPSWPTAAPSPFGAADPETRARRIARALVSDIVAYHGERRDRSLAAGTLRGDFREEILKSWDEYVEQVGVEIAKGSPFFRDALNDILAQGQKVF